MKEYEEPPSDDGTIRSTQNAQTPVSWRAACRVGFIIGLISISISACDFFGIRSATRTASEETVHAISAGWFGVYGDANHKIQVVLFDQDAYEEKGWPLSYRELAFFIHAMKEANAHSVFIDLILTLPRRSVFNSNNESINKSGLPASHEEVLTFCDFARYLRNTVPLDRNTNHASSQSVEQSPTWLDYVLDNSNTGNHTLDCLDRALDASQEDLLRDSLVPPMFRGHYAANLMLKAPPDLPRILIGADRHYLNNPMPEIELRTDAWAKQAILDRLIVLVPLGVGTGDDRGYRLRVDEAGFPSPALLLANHDCYRGAGSNGCSDYKNNGDIQDGLFVWPDDTMYLTWGALNQEGIPETCYDSGEIGDFIRQQLLYGTGPGTTKGKTVRNLGCPPNPTLLYKRFTDVFRKGPNSVTNYAEERIRDSVAARHVFLGVDVQVVDDTLIAPLYGSIPAVHAHAVAYKNLHQFSDPYQYPDELSWWSICSWLLEFLLIFLACSLLIYYRDEANQKKHLLAELIWRQGNKRTILIGIGLVFLLGALLMGLSEPLLNGQTDNIVADILTLTVLGLLFLLCLFGPVLIIFDKLRKAYPTGRFRPGEALKILVSQMVLLSVFLAVGISIAVFLSLFLHWPPVNFLVSFVLICGWLLVINREKFRQALDHLLNSKDLTEATLSNVE